MIAATGLHDYDSDATHDGKLRAWSMHSNTGHETGSQHGPGSVVTAMLLGCLESKETRQLVANYCNLTRKLLSKVKMWKAYTQEDPGLSCCQIRFPSSSATWMP